MPVVWVQSRRDAKIIILWCMRFYKNSASLRLRVLCVIHKLMNKK